MQEISVELKVLLTRAGLKAKDIATKTNMPPSKVSKILNGHQVPAWNEISAIAQSCGCTADITFIPNK